jgi:hypothetical protein
LCEDGGIETKKKMNSLSFKLRKDQIFITSDSTVRRNFTQALKVYIAELKCHDLNWIPTCTICMT